MNNILINISGGAIKLIALISCFKRIIESGIKPKHISGVSSGAIICFCYVCGALDEAYEMAKNSSDRRIIFSWWNDPVGKISGYSSRAILKLLTGKNYIGIMDNLEKNIRKICSVHSFESYTSDPLSPNCYILSINEKTRKKVLVNIKHMDYEEAISYVIGSSSIAPIIKAREVKFAGQSIYLNDGGHRDHSAGSYILENDIVNDIDESLTIWSRENPRVYDGGYEIDTSSFGKRLENFTLGTQIMEGSLNDEYKEKRECEKRNIISSHIYIDKFTSDTYNISQKQIWDGVRIGVDNANKYLNSKQCF